MTFIHQRHDWPAFTWRADSLLPILADVRHRQGRLLGTMEALGFTLRAEASLTMLATDVVKSSAIEGEVLDPKEVRSSIARRLGLDTGGLPVASRNVEGIVEMVLDATQHHDAPLSPERLFGWQAALSPTGRSGLQRMTVGAWRPPEGDPMQVVSGPYGRERVHFEAPRAARLDQEMAAFVEWFNGSAPTDPVLKAAIAHLWFVTIHPFDDGNGRIGRAIADMAMARADGCQERFYSMSAQIEAERRDYYAQLERQQRGDLDITGWLVWFLQCLGRAIDAAEAALSTVLSKTRLWAWINRTPVHDRQRIVINRLVDDFAGPLTTAKYARLAKCSGDTALRDIQGLLARGILIQNDRGGRSTSYRLAPPDDLETSTS